MFARLRDPKCLGTNGRQKMDASKGMRIESVQENGGLKEGQNARQLREEYEKAPALIQLLSAYAGACRDNGKMTDERAEGMRSDEGRCCARMVSPYSGAPTISSRVIHAAIYGESVRLIGVNGRQRAWRKMAARRAPPYATRNAHSYQTPNHICCVVRVRMI